LAGIARLAGRRRPYDRVPKGGNTVFKTIRSLLQDDHGQGLAEYGLILALVAVVCVGATQTLGTKVSNTMGTLSGNLP
jgi:pilus assembly protein Flp/PilA